ncbi:hypothetical protein BH23GEM6_BH23GEM6_12500 [soil metagenome]
MNSRMASDLRRIFWREPAVTATLIGTLALAVGLAAPVLALVRAGLLTERIYTDPLLAAGEAANAVLHPWSERARSMALIQHDSLQILLWVSFSLAALLVAVSIINILVLLLARGAARKPEMTIRVVLGAPRATLIRGLALEGLVLVAIGVSLGTMIGIGVTLSLRSLWPHQTAPWLDVGQGTNAVMAVVGILCCVTLLTLLAPARAAWYRDLRKHLTTGERATSGPGEVLMRNALAVVQIGASLILLTVAGLLLMGFAGDADGARVSGANPHDTLYVQLMLPETSTSDLRDRSRMYAQALQLAASLPGALDTSMASIGTSVGIGTQDMVHGLTGNPVEPGWVRPASYHTAGPDYFRTLGIPLRRGREFSSDDSAESPLVAVVNETFVSSFRLTGGGIGRKLQLHRTSFDGPWYTIVGVVDDVPVQAVGASGELIPRVYLSTLQHPPAAVELAVRTRGDPLLLLEPLEQALSTAVPAGRVTNAMTTHELYRTMRSPLRWFAWISGLLAGASLLLCLAGLHAVMSFNVARRRREIGIRMALGARAGDVVRMVLKQAGGITAIGSLVGLMGALSLSRLLQILVSGVKPLDPILLVGLALSLGSVALLASYRPARRAAMVDPQAAIRTD